MQSTNKKAFFGNYLFEICENVYDPAEDSFLFAQNLHLKRGARLLDMGTGSGLLGILAAKEASEVFAVDINPYAIRCAKQNSLLNNVTTNVAFLQTDLFSAFRESAKFDVILFNAPYLPSEQLDDATWLERAWEGGTTGRQIIDRFISQVPQHLEKTGEILLLQSNLANIEETVAKFQTLGMNVEVAARLKMPFFEDLSLLRIYFTER